MSVVKNKSIAVIMSVYKNDNLLFLKESLTSLFNQTSKDFDIFIQQDGIISDDVETYLNSQLNEGKIFYLGKRNENRGLAYSLNELLNLVLDKYKYIARMDADDISLPERIEKQFEFMEKNTDIDFCGAFIQEFDISSGKKKIIEYPLTNEGCLDLFCFRNPFAHPVIFFRDSFFKKSGLYPTYTQCHEDTILFLNGFLKGCCGSNLNMVLLHFRIDKNFFKRRKKYKFSKLKDRLLIIKKMSYPSYTYFFPILRYCIQCLPAFLLKFVYRLR